MKDCIHRDFLKASFFFFPRFVFYIFAAVAGKNVAATASERCSRLQRCVAAGVKGYRVADSGLASALLAACAPAAAGTGEASERRQRRSPTSPFFIAAAVARRSRRTVAPRGGGNAKPIRNKTKREAATSCCRKVKATINDQILERKQK